MYVTADGNINVVVEKLDLLAAGRYIDAYESKAVHEGSTKFVIAGK